MAINERIRAYLTVERDKAIDLVRRDQLAIDMLAQYENTKFQEFAKQLYDELLTNFRDYWHYVEVPFDGIVFDYNHIEQIDAETVAYGIILTNSADFKVQVEPYAMANGYDFAQPLEAAPAFTLSLLNGLYPLWAPRDSAVFVSLQSVNKLLDAYLYTTYLVIQDALQFFIETNEFKNMRRQSPFHFLIKNPVGGNQPLYILE